MNANWIDLHADKDIKHLTGQSNISSNSPTFGLLDIEAPAWLIIIFSTWYIYFVLFFVTWILQIIADFFYAHSRDESLAAKLCMWYLWHLLRGWRNLKASYLLHLQKYRSEDMKVNQCKMAKSLRKIYEHIFMASV